jgi:quercetin dioxygenase-like cupin family protein
MKNLLVLMLASLLAATATAQKVTPLLTKPMPEQPGRQIEVITVDFAPGAVNPVHRHNAHAVVYVLNGEIRDAGKRRHAPAPGFWSSLL